MQWQGKKNWMSKWSSKILWAKLLLTYFYTSWSSCPPITIFSYFILVFLCYPYHPDIFACSSFLWPIFITNLKPCQFSFLPVTHTPTAISLAETSSPCDGQQSPASCSHTVLSWLSGSKEQNCTLHGPGKRPCAQNEIIFCAEIGFDRKSYSMKTWSSISSASTQRLESSLGRLRNELLQGIHSL